MQKFSYIDFFGNFAENSRIGKLHLLLRSFVQFFSTQPAENFFINNNILKNNTK